MFSAALTGFIFLFRCGGKATIPLQYFNFYRSIFLTKVFVLVLKKVCTLPPLTVTDRPLQRVCQAVIRQQ